MKAKNRDKLLRRVLKAMRHCHNPHTRQDLYYLGDSLVAEYKDLNKEKVEERLTKLEDRTGAAPKEPERPKTAEAVIPVQPVS